MIPEYGLVLTLEYWKVWTYSVLSYHKGLHVSVSLLILINHCRLLAGLCGLLNIYFWREVGQRTKRHLKYFQPYLIWHLTVDTFLLTVIKWYLCSLIQWGLKRLKDFPRSFWLALFIEGTWFTPAKLLAAQEYAASQGLPAPRNVLIPRTKVCIFAASWLKFCLLPWKFPVLHVKC